MKNPFQKKIYDDFDFEHEHESTIDDAENFVVFVSVWAGSEGSVELVRVYPSSSCKYCDITAIVSNTDAWADIIEKAQEEAISRYESRQLDDADDALKAWKEEK